MNLKAVTGSGIEQRKVKGSETIAVGSLTYRAGDLLSLRIEPRIGDDLPAALVMFTNGTGRYVSFRGGERVTIGVDSWSVDELIELELAGPPVPVESVRPYREGTWRVHFLDGSTQLLEGVERFEELSVWEFHEGIARPPRELVESG